jgi:hypothetical protein
MFAVMITLFPLAAQATDPTPPVLINLQCDVIFSNYRGIEHAATHEKVSLTALKQQTGGAKLVTQTDDFEFWVMVHGMQNLNGQDFINNYQVAIKEKSTGLFMHALSDTSHDPWQPPSKARISLVDYQPGSFLEKGELLFECTTI